jgi:hypothetical protein
MSKKFNFLFAGLFVVGSFAAVAQPLPQPLPQHGEPHGGEAHGSQAHGGEAPHGGPQHVGGGYIPQRGPQPSHGRPQEAHGAPAHDASAHDARDFRDGDGHPNAPHVHNDGSWVGHDGNRGAYHLDHPWEHGRFRGQLGPRYVYRLHGGGPSRFEFNGFYFGIAEPDLAYVNGWDWNSDDIILYDDPDDPGYYLAYNPRFGVYVHVLYMG